MKTMPDLVEKRGFVFFWRGWPSQWHPARLTVEGVAYTCAEQFMMAEKARLFGDGATRKRILATGSPRAQKALGRQVSPFDDARWMPACRDIVYRGNVAKFSQNVELRDLLLATGELTLAEASPTDRIWGIGLAVEDPRATKRTEWRGTNWLGARSPLDGAIAPRQAPPMRCAIPLLALVSLPACSQSATQISIGITAGQETTAFTDADVSSCAINIQSLETPTPTVNVTVNAAPGQTFDVPSDISGAEQVTITVSCTDSAGTVVMTGESLSGLLLGAVTGAIPVFVQRVEQWARPPGSLLCSHVGGVAADGAERFMMLTGGAKATGDTSACSMSDTDGYDIFTLSGDVPESIFGSGVDTLVNLGSPGIVAISGENAWLIDLSGVNGSVNLAVTPGIQGPLTSFADVAGGTVILGPTSSYVVGPTRSKYGPSQMVLEISNDASTLTSYKLSAPRQDAAALWAQNADATGFAGLVVAGGNGAADVAGVELLDASGTLSTLPYPPDGTTGAGAVYDGVDGIFLFGGVGADGTTPGASRHLLLSCNPCNFAPACTGDAPCAFDTTALPALTGVSAYRLPTGASLVLGTEVASTRMYRSFVVDTTNLAIVTVMEALFREPRSGATPFPAPTGSLAVLGGQHADGSPALSMELFQP